MKLSPYSSLLMSCVMTSSISEECIASYMYIIIIIYSCEGAVPRLIGLLFIDAVFVIIGIIPNSCAY